jgi:hypothetical protein
MNDVIVADTATNDRSVGPDADAAKDAIAADNANDSTVTSDAPPDSSVEDAPADNAIPDASDAAADVGGCIASVDLCSCASFNGHAYRFCTMGRMSGDADNQCTFYGMRLARVDDAIENGFIRSTADAHGLLNLEMWVGIQDPSRTLQWQWPDGTVFWMGDASGSAVGGHYANWAATKPSGNTVRNCGSMLAAGSWQDRSCTSVLPYVCEGP